MKLKALQENFASAMRDPDERLAFDVEPRRLAIYRRLVFNNIYNLVGGTFKRLKAIVGDDIFRAWVRAFIQAEVSTTPYFSQISKEFEQWFLGTDADPIYKDLARYERAIIDLDIDAHVLPDVATVLTAEASVVFNPAFILMQLDHPVYLISRTDPDIKVAEVPELSFVCLFRNPHNRLRYKRLSPAAYALLSLLLSGETIVDTCRVLSEHLQQDAESLIAFAIETLHDLQAEGAVIGAR